jgi:dihydrofolate reductase
MPKPRRIEGYAIVSEDGIIADAAGHMPAALHFEADKRFFEQGLDGVDVVVHGRHSHEQQAHSNSRPRLVLTRRIADIAPDPANAPGPGNAKVLFWNPAGAPLEAALTALGKPDAALGIVGGTDVFGLFLGRYSAFHLSRAPNGCLQGGRPVFPGVPETTPETILARSGLVAGPPRILDSTKGLSVVSWHMPASR